MNELGKLVIEGNLEFHHDCCGDMLYIGSESFVNGYVFLDELLRTYFAEDSHGDINVGRVRITVERLEDSDAS